MLRNIAALTLLFFLFQVQHVQAGIQLPKLVGDSMVIQRDTKVRLWGWADANERIRIKFRGRSLSTTAKSDGSWEVWMPATSAGGPYTMVITGRDTTITLRDILVGDVWLCSGQSNMVHYLELHQDRYAAEVAAANYPQIRQFTVPTLATLEGPTKDLPSGSWMTATRANILRFSVVAYFFAKKLHEAYGIPIGIINASVGGTPIESWTSEEGLREFPDIARTIARNKDTARVNEINRTAAQKRRSGEAVRPPDKGLQGPVHWYDPDFKPEGWRTMSIPGYWEDQGIRNLDGIVWFRREVDVPASMTGKTVRLSMGRIVDADQVYVNGVQVGNKTYQYPQRRYDVAPGVLKPGKNVITVRVTNYGGKGGFVPDKPYYLGVDGDTIDLTGYWQYEVGSVFPRAPFAPGINVPNQPTASFNAMLAPLLPYALKGFVWYQGESNAERPQTYEALQRALIRDWRNKWGNLPFLFVQLPNFMEATYEPTESNWAALRDAQRRALSEPNTAMAVAIDLGEWNDIHPGNKKAIGERLALAAQKLAYRANIVYSGPLVRSAVAEGRKVRISFDHVGSGLVAGDDGEVHEVAIAGEDRHFVWAKARIENNTVVAWNDEIAYPVYVRYAWADNPVDANLRNREGLPASPFEVQVEGTDQLWYGKKAAVVLTYDDALDGHLDVVIPALDARGFKGSFYLSAAFPGSKNRVADWRRAARDGHELGNHTLFHPCEGSGPGREWVSPSNDLSRYTTEEIVREIEMTNTFLFAIDGKKERTFAYPCGDTETGEGSYIEAIRNQFISMRGVRGRLNHADSLDLANLNCYVVDNNNADQLIAWAEQARKENALLIVLFHGVGGGHPINVDLEKHNKFLDYLKEHEDSFWVTTLLDASKHWMRHSRSPISHTSR
ncbi:MAG: sialate O-acetylesterase [Bacteroidota bacterium]|jgi:sialate O-acetylesterase|nr:MAG: hypothetical protein DIU61_05530 [Bacteroidota bacterium]